MACFIVPGTEAIVTTIVTGVVKKKEKEAEGKTSTETAPLNENGKVRFSTKLGWLNNMLWGGSALLAFEHVWHGEVIPTFPFLTAVKNGEVADMLGEMSTAGVAMALLVTAVWGGMLVVSSVIEKRSAESKEAES
ncbi:MAG: hypothetical protein K6A38_00380 [Lachnospiraceae bacterium]|nr:hypothetical protein [Lachnospiraceae bacterium]